MELKNIVTMTATGIGNMIYSQQFCVAFYRLQMKRKKFFKNTKPIDKIIVFNVKKSLKSPCLKI